MKSNTSDAGLAALGCLGFIALFAVILAISALVILFAWNVGVVALVAAAGGSVSKIGFWTALAAAFIINILRSIFSRPAQTS